MFGTASLTCAFTSALSPRATLPSRSTRRGGQAVAAAARSASRAVVRPPAVGMKPFESLEARQFLSVTPDPGSTPATAHYLGDLNGSVTLDDTVGNGDTSDWYKFNLTKPGQFFGRLRAYNANAEIDLLQEQFDSNGNRVVTLVDSRVANQAGPDAGFASGDLPGRNLQPGTYYLAVTQLAGATPYLIRFTADYAGNALSTARDIGSATDDTYRDFVGQFGSPSLDDAQDYYKVKLDAAGQLNVNFSLENTDPSLFKAHVDLIRDANGNNILDPGDLLQSTPSGTSGSISRSVGAGTYFLKVATDLDYSNYTLHVNADYAGTSPGQSRAVGSVDVAKSFNDFVGNPQDPYDQYAFTVNGPGSRPLLINESQSGGGTSYLSLYKDANHDGFADPSELVVSTTATSFNSLLQTVSAGNYIARVSAFGGSGKYGISIEAPPDAAGNTLAAAKNLGVVNGLKNLNPEYVSTADTVDYYKFTLASAGSVGAQLDPYLGANADLTLIKDANNNGKVDAGEVLAATSAPGNQPDSLSKSLAAGNYFLGVTYKGSAPVSRYFLTFQTDLAGNSAATARNVGALAGTKTFDDWASQNYGGVINDTVDLYKFTLSGNKTLTAKTVGQLSGEDLTLQLFQDKNGNGTFEANELIAASGKPNSPNEQIVKALKSGTYFVRVVGTNGDTNYRLTLTA